MNVTRTTNQNGTFRYEIDGQVQYKASKVLYTHVSTYTNGAVTFHKTQAAADRTKGYKHWTKAGVVAITDGDAPAAAPAPAEPDVTTVVAELVRPGHVLVKKDGTRYRVSSVHTRVDPRTLKLDPTRRTVHTRDSEGVTKVFAITVGRNIRVAK